MKRSVRPTLRLTSAQLGRDQIWQKEEFVATEKGSRNDFPPPSPLPGQRVCSRRFAHPPLTSTRGALLFVHQL